MKDKNKRIAIGKWFKKIQDDELTVASLLKHRDGSPGTVCFLSQQIAEKSLKALLIFFDVELEKVHDLKKLLSLLENHVSVSELGEESALLNRYYIETRYVGNFPEFSWIEAQQAWQAAEKIKNFVLNCLK